MDITAQQYPTCEGRPLVDYISVLLPCQILAVDALIVERRQLASPVEFVLKTCKAGIESPDDIGEFLGFNPRFTNLLIEQMKADEMIASEIDGRIRILRPGKEALDQNGDRVHLDKTIMVVWDPITESTLTKRQELLTERTKPSGSLRVRFPAILGKVSVGQLQVSAIQASRRAFRDIDAENDREDILRFVGIRRVLHRYRQAILLFYENGKAAPIIKIAVDDKIDESLSSAFAQKEGGQFIGADVRFLRRSGSVAVEERMRLLKVSSATGVSCDELSRKRALHNFMINSIRPRLADSDASESLRSQMEKYISDLNEVEVQLSSIPVRPLAATEVTLCLKEALVKAVRFVTITTTGPTDERFSKEVIDGFDAALRRGVAITVYIADRISDAAPSKTGRSTPLARLNELINRHAPLMSVKFLSIVARPVFEIYWDGEELVFANDPPLGSRQDANIPRVFRGFRLSGPKVVGKYVESHLTFASSDFIKHLERTTKPVAQKPVTKAVKRKPNIIPIN